MKFSINFAAAIAATFSALALPASASGTPTSASPASHTLDPAMAANFLINVTVADLASLREMPTIDPSNATQIMAALEQYGKQPGSYGVSLSVIHPDATTTAGVREGVSQTCLLNCAIVAWWGPLVYAM
ncbi:unnamed protein product [Discula destructiva]